MIFTICCVVGWQALNTILMWYLFLKPLIKSESDDEARLDRKDPAEAQAAWDREHA